MTASDPREAAETALMAAADEYGEECADRQNLPYKYGTVESRKDSEEWAAVRAAYRQAVIAELEAMPCECGPVMMMMSGPSIESCLRCARIAELRGAP